MHFLLGLLLTLADSGQRTLGIAAPDALREMLLSAAPFLGGKVYPPHSDATVVCYINFVVLQCKQNGT